MSDNRNQAIVMAVGVGAVGTILAYLGYSIFSDETNKEAVNNNVSEELNEKSLLSEIKVDNKEKSSIFYNFWNSTFNKTDQNNENKVSENKDAKNNDSDYDPDDDYKQRYHY